VPAAAKSSSEHERKAPAVIASGTDLTRTQYVLTSGVSRVKLQTVCKKEVGHTGPFEFS
jgi:hypothetical protein